MAKSKSNQQAEEKTASKVSKTKAEQTVTTPTVGYISDYVSGVKVRATPEETEAVQIFSRRLVEDFGYPKAHITTRPQFRVRSRPSDESRSKGYPVDIVVFDGSAKLEDHATIIVECKQPDTKTGEKQLKLYLGMSSANIGVWFNGKTHIYLYKALQTNGSIEWIHLPTLPRFGQSVSDIGSLLRKELTIPSNLKAVFKDIRNHLAGNTTGITRDQELAQEIMAILFCKIYDELDKAPDDIVDFRTGVDDKPLTVKKRLSALFDKVKTQYQDVFRVGDTISLDPASIKYVVGELQNYLVSQASRDAIGDAFEVFIGPAVRGEEGQFFTPRNVVQMLVELLDPKPGETIVDPACGSGGFLVVALEHIWKQVEREAQHKKWLPERLALQKRDIAMRTIRGIDKDAFLTRLTKAYMAIIGDGRGGIYCEDGLDLPKNWRSDARSNVELGSFDIVITNPPFGSKIKVSGPEKLSQYNLAKRWKLPKGKDWEQTTELHDDQPPQILFIERCIQLLKPRGRMAVILPESIFGMPVYGYVVKWLYDNYKLRAFVSLPEEVFQPYTHAKTCVVILTNEPPEMDDTIEMAIADWCGHDSRGNPTVRKNEAGERYLLDDLPKISAGLKHRLSW